MRPPEGNVAVTAVRREGQAVVVAVHNFGARPARCRCACELDGRELATERVDVAPQSAAEVRLVAALPPRGGVEVSYRRSAGLSGRQRALRRARSGHRGAGRSCSPLTRRVRRAPASTSNARSASPTTVRRFRRASIDGRRFSALTPEEFGAAGGHHRARDEHARSAGTRARRRVPAQRRTRAADARTGCRPRARSTTRVGVDLGVDARARSTRAGTVTLVAVDARHPIFRPFLSPTGALGDVYVEQYRRLNDQGGRTVLARFSGGAAALTEQPVETRAAAGVRLRSGQPVESVSTESGVRAICRGIGEIPDTGPERAADVHSAGCAAGVPPGGKCHRCAVIPGAPGRRQGYIVCRPRAGAAGTARRRQRRYPGIESGANVQRGIFCGNYAVEAVCRSTGRRGGAGAGRTTAALAAGTAGDVPGAGG